MSIVNNEPMFWFVNCPVPRPTSILGPKRLSKSETMVRRNVKSGFSQILSQENTSSIDSEKTANPGDYSSFGSDNSENTSSRLKYRRLRGSLEDHGFTEEQFEVPEVRVPWRAIALATFLFVAGWTAITFSALSITGYIKKIPEEGPIVLMGLGFLMFIPGFYHVRIAYYAFKEYPGYSFDDIPDFNWSSPFVYSTSTKTNINYTT